MKGIADTGFLVAFANRNDRHHDWAVGVAETVVEPLLTCEAVLADTAFHLQDVEIVLEMVREGLIAMRFVEGENLAQRITASKPTADTSNSASFIIRSKGGLTEPDSVSVQGPKTLPPTTMPREQLNALLAVFEKSARALHAAHQAGILHRDIKPGNIMVIKEGEPVILDFGLARDESADVSLTHPGDVFGTPAYMSPEQIAGQCVRLDARSDVYSLGVTLYECLTIVRPFDAATRESLYQAVMTKEPPDPRRFNRSIRGLPAATRSQCCLRDSNGKFGSLPRGCGRRSMGTALEFS